MITTPSAVSDALIKPRKGILIDGQQSQQGSRGGYVRHAPTGARPCCTNLQIITWRTAKISAAAVRAGGCSREGFDKPEGFLQRQVDRRSSLLASFRETENYAGREIPGFHHAGDWLRAITPKTLCHGIIHGDS